MNYRNRVLTFALGCLVLGLHLAEIDAPPWVWGALVMQFLLYPHAVYWRARQSDEPLKAETANMRLDALLFGMWVAGLGFPLWIALLLLLTTAMNLAAFGGLRGGRAALVAQGLGMVLAMGVLGVRFEPATSLTVSLLCMATLAGYLVLYGLGAYSRTLKLHQVRQQLRNNEKALQSQLAEIRLLQSQLKEQVDRDHLTGLYNRRHLAATIDREFARCRREEAPLSLMMIDIDHFKQINDRHGHPFGDKVLAMVAATLESSLRAGDIACRYGGEEFLLLMPNMAWATACERAAELRDRVAGLTIVVDGEVQRVRISVGVAEAPRHAREPEALIAQADAALYRAKMKGRNRVVAAHASGDTEPAAIA